jgi:hypothetical protein
MALVIGLPAATWAQGKPDFSGTWKLSASNVPSYSAPNPAYQESTGFGGPAPTMIIKQSPTEITVESGQFDAAPMKVVYKLDGSDTIWQAPWTATSSATDLAGSHAVVRWRTKARWDGSKLVLYTWNTALNQMRDTMTLSNGQINIVRGIETPGSSKNAMLTYSKGP